MKFTSLTTFALVLASYCGSLAAGEPQAVEETVTSWGRIFVSKLLGSERIILADFQNSDKLLLPKPHPNVTRALRVVDPKRLEVPVQPMPMIYDSETAAISLSLKDRKADDRTGEIWVETAEKSQQYPDGRITFSALDAVVHGNTAKLETQPGNHRIGFWTNPDDFVSWDYEATRPGRYDVELTYSLADKETAAYVAVGKEVVTATLKQTTSWYQYSAVTLGQIYIASPGKATVTVKCLKKTGDAVMNLKAVTLRPRSEGQPILRSSGAIVCHARDATIHGVKLQYEPKPEKNTVGYWVIPQDYVSWDFEPNTGGEFEVEILQGCGKGEGGSEVELSIGDETLRFTVEDTGHFQNFVPRVIGTVKLNGGSRRTLYRLQVKPIKLAHHAVMDLRQVRLIPVAKK